MSIGLQDLLETRRRAEEEAERALASAVDLRVRADEEQRRLDECAAAADAQARAAANDSGATTAAQAWAAERYRARLGGTARQVRKAALTHRKSTQRPAQAAEEEARSAHAAARRDREAIEQLDERQQTERRRLSERRAEDAASDQAGRGPSTPGLR
jgi:flagellar biosynthesis chaperone FliJ